MIAGMTHITARVPTIHGPKYVQQLCKHWAHKLHVEFENNIGVVHFEGAIATMIADADGISITVEGEHMDVLERWQNVLAIHLDRFAFREAPLPFAWTS